MLSNRSSFKSLLKTNNQKNQNLQQNNIKHQPSQLSSAISTQQICIISDQYSKTKLLQLQQQIFKLRKQMTQKESYHNKEKGTLLNKLQILSAQNIQIKQRQTNLVKLNQTLQLALGSTNHRQNNTMINKQLQQLRQQVNDKNTMMRQAKRTIQEYKKMIRNIQSQKYKIVEQKQKMIFNLNNKLKTIKGQKQHMINMIKNDILSLPFKKQMINMILKSINCFQDNSDFIQSDIFAQSNSSSQYLESPISKRKNLIQLKGFKQSKIMDRSYSHFSANSIINQLNKRQIQSEFSQQNEQSQKLLCQVCKKVFEQQQFIQHMDQCNQMHQLHKKRSQLQKAIDQLNMQQRKSTSQKKKVMIQKRSPLQQWNLNTDRDTSKNKLSANKLMNYNKSNRFTGQKNLNNMSQAFNNYKSNRLY